MTEDMPHVMEWHNGAKERAPFSEAEMARRWDGIRAWMESAGLDAVLLTSTAAISHGSGWVCRALGRKVGMVITQQAATTISPGIDGGLAWRRGFGGNVSYTDFRRDNFWRAVRQLTPGVRRLGIEFDHMALSFRRDLEAALPGVQFSDAGGALMALRRIKSAEELDLITQAARIADLGAAAAVAVARVGVPEYEVAQAASLAMQRAAAGFPRVDLSPDWVRFQSGLNTDGALNPVTNRRIVAQELLRLTCLPRLFGYASALARTLSCGRPDAQTMDLWHKTLTVHRQGQALIRPGLRCSDLAAELNAIYRDEGLLPGRAAGFGLLPDDPGLRLGEEVDTVLQPGMVIALAPLMLRPEGQPGAGGYAEADTLIVTQDGAKRVTQFPLGPDHNILDG